MTCYADSVWLFPFGAAPDLRHPVTVVVLEPPTRERDVVQATYVTTTEMG